jgi:hypothetical protein
MQSITQPKKPRKKENTLDRCAPTSRAINIHLRMYHHTTNFIQRELQAVLQSGKPKTPGFRT